MRLHLPLEVDVHGHGSSVATSIPPTGDEELPRVTHIQSTGHKLVLDRAKTMRHDLHRLGLLVRARMDHTNL